MEVNDRPKKSGGDGEHDQGFKRLKIIHSQWLFTGNGSFFNELKLWGKHLLIAYVYFLTSLLELCAKTARYNGLVLILPLNTLFFQRLYCIFNCFIKLVRNEQYMLEK
jgi:hypothetical protein